MRWNTFLTTSLPANHRRFLKCWRVAGKTASSWKEAKLGFENCAFLFWHHHGLLLCPKARFSPPECFHVAFCSLSHLWAPGLVRSPRLEQCIRAIAKLPAQSIVASPIARLGAQTHPSPSVLLGLPTSRGWDASPHKPGSTWSTYLGPGCWERLPGSHLRCSPCAKKNLSWPLVSVLAQNNS